MAGLEYVRTINVGQHVEGCVSYGSEVVIMRFPKVPYGRAARGWRKHQRRMKAAQRRARR